MLRTCLIILIAVLAASCATGRFEDPATDVGTSDDADNTVPPQCLTPPCGKGDEGCVDLDRDGFGTGCALGLDCDDTSPDRAPNLVEICDGKDNDCNGAIDDGISCTGPVNNPPGGCTDLDQDGYGDGCVAGLDCDDADSTRFMGAPELCDGKDNDCDGGVDEDVPVGADCTEGLGPCAASGSLTCSADGTAAECDAVPGQPQDEVCDRVDNDCDGTVDDGLNCPACIEDSNEPDDSSPTGTSLTSGSRTGQLCPGNADWFRLGDYNAGQQVRVSLEFTHASGDLDMEMYVGSTYETGSYSATDGESITQTLTKSGAVTIRVYFDPGSTPPASGNAYTIRRP